MEVQLPEEGFKRQDLNGYTDEIVKNKGAFCRFVWIWHAGDVRKLWKE